MTRVGDLADVIGARLEFVGAGAPADPAQRPEAHADDVSVTGIDLWAQDIRPGDLFAALPGARSHGASFATIALERGAVAVLTDEEGRDVVARAATAPVAVLVHSDPRAVLGEASATVYGHASRKMQVVGITGTSGKTTTAYLVDAGLTAAGRTTGLVGTVETRVAGERLPSSLTTPEAPHLHALFAIMLERGVDTVVMEVSSHALALGRVAATGFEVAAFTNLSQDHLDFHRDLDDYFGAKAGLFSVDSPVRARRAVVCIDDEWGRRMADIARVGRSEADAVRTVGAATDIDPGGRADWTIDEVTADTDGSQSFTLTGPGAVTRPVRVGLPGRYNVTNAALAVAICAAAGADVDAVARGIAAVSVPGRVERVERGQDFLAVVDYAHKPAALEAVLDTLRAATDGRVAVVVGAGGDRDRGKRPVMGEVAARKADLVVVTDDNPRTEDAAAIRTAVVAGAQSVPAGERGEIREVGDRADAIETAVRWARTGDVVLIAGKGHETGQEIDGVKHPFDDREVVADALGRRVGVAPDGRHPSAGGGTNHGGIA